MMFESALLFNLGFRFVADKLTMECADRLMQVLGILVRYAVIMLHDTARLY